MSGILFLLPLKSIEETAVLQSQVLEPALHLAQKGFRVHILGYEKEGLEKLSYYPRISSAGISLVVNQLPNLFLRLISMSFQALRICRKERIDILYFREIWGGILALSVLRGRVKRIYDIRALIAEESAYRHNRKFPNYYLLKWIERRLIKSADRISVVSRKLKDYVLSQVPGKSVRVLPSGVNSQKIYYSTKDRAEIRSRYAIGPEDIVFIYIGSISKWQQFDLVAQTFSELSASLTNSKLLVITPDKEKVLGKYGALLQDSGSVILLDRVPHEEIFRYLSAGDLGFLIREQHILNIVSSPIKFAEYLICGIPVITTPWVGDYSEEVQQKELGLVFNPDDPKLKEEILQFARDYQKNIDSYKQRCIQYAEQWLSWDYLSSELENLYQFEQLPFDGI
jgi:glycosyltransferase involved in cell wall biosynthesis